MHTQKNNSLSFRITQEDVYEVDMVINKIVYELQLFLNVYTSSTCYSLYISLKVSKTKLTSGFLQLGTVLPTG